MTESSLGDFAIDFYVFHTLVALVDALRFFHTLAVRAFHRRITRKGSRLHVVIGRHLAFSECDGHRLVQWVSGSRRCCFFLWISRHK